MKNVLLMFNQKNQCKVVAESKKWIGESSVYNLIPAKVGFVFFTASAKLKFYFCYCLSSSAHPLFSIEDMARAFYKFFAV